MEISSLDAGTPFLWRVLLTVSLSFLIGLEFHKYQRGEGQGVGFGTARTLTLIGLMGFLLFSLDRSATLYALGFAILAVWLALYYHRRLEDGYSSLMAPVVCLLVYLLGLLAAAAPEWLVAAYAVVIIFLLSAKPLIRSFADTVSGNEIATVVKFVIMAAIVLPLLPDRQIADFIPVNFRQTWFAVVAVSGISYLSYVAQTYVFKARGVLVAGTLGGLYSSTAATFALAGQARSTPNNTLISPAIILATAMMYVRLLVLAGMLAPASLPLLVPPLGAAALLSLAAALILARLRERSREPKPTALGGHPLEFQAALLFALLFVLFATATQYIVGHYSEAGLHVMSLIVGVTDIDPFVLSVLTGHLEISLRTAADAVILAAASNNLLKAGYALAMARNRSVAVASGWLAALALLSMLYVFL
jgi:uncharacterized membrane protein (DUF4010 family)